MGQRVYICIHSTLVDNAKPFSKMAVPIYMPSSSVWEFQLFYTLNLCIFVLFLPIHISTNIQLVNFYTNYAVILTMMNTEINVILSSICFYCILLHLFRSSLISANKVLKLPSWVLNLHKLTSYVSTPQILVT